MVLDVLVLSDCLYMNFWISMHLVLVSDDTISVRLDTLGELFKVVVFNLYASRGRVTLMACRLGLHVALIRY